MENPAQGGDQPTTQAAYDTFENYQEKYEYDRPEIWQDFYKEETVPAHTQKPRVKDAVLNFPPDKPELKMINGFPPWLTK